MFASKDLFFSKPSGYQISRSVRLRASATAYFNRTPASAGNRTTWTLSCWMKRGALSAAMVPFSAGAVGNEFVLDWRGFDALDFYDQTASVSSAAMTTNAVYRDPSAWYHIVFAWDTTQATSTNRWKLYINGVQITSFSATQYPAQNYQGYVNSTVAHYIGIRAGTTTPFDGYLTEINFIDGQALTPSSFGQTNTITGVWQPLKYTGTYGTNGFYLNFSDNSAATAAAIGKDYSGNSNNWTPNNISVTAGVTYDSMIDVPTLFADGGNGRGNYCTLNPLIQRWAINAAVFSQANLNVTTTNASSSFGIGTMFVSTGKWYWEATLTAAGTATPGTGVGDNQVQSGTFTNLIEYNKDGSQTPAGTAWATYTTNDVIGVAMDCDGGTISFYKNNVLQGSKSLTAGVAYAPLMDVVLNAAWTPTFGQRPFSYTPPTGFVALNTQNLPTPTISNGATVMAATTYTGTGATQSIVNSGNNTGAISFKPDWVWIKSRSAATNNNLFDSVRGATNYIISNSNGAEATNANTLTAFGTTGFTLGSDAGSVGVNVNAATYVAWQWQAGQGSTSSNTSGSITSTVSVNATAGFSIVTYTGTGANATVGHGLGVAPKMIFVKKRSAIQSWSVYHASLANTQYLVLDTTAAVATLATMWNSTSPTSTVFSIGTDGNVNASTATYVAYCFSAVAGYSAFGSYTGNGSSDGPFVYLGFRPRWVLFKVSSAAGFDWLLYDSSRNTYNVTNLNLRPDLSDAEGSQTANNLDFLSNGFKIRGDSTGSINPAQTIIYAAFAENPFKLALAR